MTKLRRQLRRWWLRFRRAKTDAEYAMLFHRVSRRLGAARARARQAEQDADYLKGQLAEWRADTAAKARELVDQLLEDQVQGATHGLHRRIAALEAECAALHAECISLRITASNHACAPSVPGAGLNIGANNRPGA